MADERRQKHDAQTAEIYLAISRYTASFEQLCQTMRTGMTFLLQGAGLSNQQLAHIMSADMTASPLRAIMQVIIGEHYELALDEQKICDKISAEVKRQYERRNEVLHSTAYVGWGNGETTHLSAMDAHKLTRGKADAGTRSVANNAEDVDRFAAECCESNELVMRLWTCLQTGRKIADNFDVDENGTVTCSAAGQ